MSSLRPAFALLAFLGATVAAAGAGITSGPTRTTARPSFGRALQKFPAEKAQVRDLPDGGRLAVGSRTGHDITVQWRDPAGRTWSKPLVVQTEARFWTHDIRVDRLGPTVAIAPDYWVEKVMDDDYAPRFTSIVVCRDYTCDGPRTSKELTSATLAEDGEVVAFGLNGRTLLLWENGKGYRRARITGMPMPSGAYRVNLLSDGTFVSVVGRWAGKKCHYDLYVGGHRTPNFTKTVESPGFFDQKPCYLSSVESKSDNRVDVWVEMLTDDISFRKSHGRWSLEARGLTRMQIKDTRGRSTLAPVHATVGQHEALFGSRDMRRIIYQNRARRSDPWSQPKVVAHAPAGTVCRMGTTGETTPIDGARPVSRAVVVVLQCYRSDRRLKREDESADVGLIFASDDGVHWRRATVLHPRQEALTSDARLVVVGSPHSLSYQPGDESLETVQLPLNMPNDGVSLSPDGTHVLRVPGNTDPNGTCVASASYAAITDRAWPPPNQFKADGLPRTGACVASASADAPDTYMVILSQPDWEFDRSLRIRNGAPELVPPADG